MQNLKIEFSIDFKQIFSNLWIWFLDIQSNCLIIILEIMNIICTCLATYLSVSSFLSSVALVALSNSIPHSELMKLFIGFYSWSSCFSSSFALTVVLIPLKLLVGALVFSLLQPLSSIVLGLSHRRWLLGQVRWVFLKKDHVTHFGD